MQPVIRKVYLSIMVSILCMITLVTVTFAWVGFLSTSSFEDFEINLNSSELEEYGIEISLTGKEGSFGSSVDAVELKKIILKNYGYPDSFLDSKGEKEINEYFRNMNLAQCSVSPKADNSFPDFYDISGNVTKGYFKFDIYVSAYHAFESGMDTDYHLDCYLEGDLLKGTKNTRRLINKFTYPSEFTNPVLNGITGNTVINGNVCIDSSSACRVAIQKYNVVDKYKPETYEETSMIQDLIIYQGGTATPTYDATTNVYSFGGIMEDKYNLALFDYNKKFPGRTKTVPVEALNRGDIEYNSENVNQIIDSSVNEEKINIDQMMKMTVYFWFEGWDADCFDIIDRNPVSLNLNFTTIKE